MVIALLLISLPSFAQTRTEELERQRTEHNAKLAPEQNTKAEEFLRQLKEKKLLERVNYGYNGISAKIGGMPTGGGFAVGPQYFRDDLKRGAITVRAAAQISTRNYRKLDAEFLLPRLLGGKAEFDVRSTYFDYRSIAYYGNGPDSVKARTNYNLEETSGDVAFRISPIRMLTFGAAGGGLAVNVGPGKDDRYASTDAVFTPAQAPGINNQTNFLRYGAFGQLDYRDDKFGPRQGGVYSVQYTRFEDRDLHLHDFNLVDVDLQQYIGFFNKTHVFALRAHTRMTDTRDGQVVPFYLRPVLGGSDDLRGYRPFRFSDNNSFAMTAEYRWAIFSGLDGAAFADAGKVFARRGQLNFRDLESSVGAGLRFNAHNQTFLRIDVGFSHEGFQVWFKFNDIFLRRSLGTADTRPIL